jgi:WD40 repeat protein
MGVCATLLVWLAAGAEPADRPSPAFESDVLPIFSQRCVECHGISKQSGGLRLDSFENVMQGGKKGAVIVPGKSAQSRLLELVRGEGKKRMPPKGDPVPTPEAEAIASWIDAGARAGPARKAEEEVKLVKLPASYAPVLAVAGDREGKRVAWGRGSAIVISRLEGAEAGKPEAVLETGGDVVQCLSFSPDGRLLASGGFREVLLWDVASWKLKLRLEPHADRVLAVAFSPRGDLLAAGGGLPSRSGEIKVWQTGTGKLLRTLADAHTDTVFSAAFSPDGSQLATGAADRMVHLFDLASLKRVARFEGHTHHVLAVAFSPDGKKLISAGADAKIKSWNVEKVESIKDWAGHSKAVTALAFSPDGKSAASAGGDRSVRIWNPDNGSQVKSFDEAKDYLYSISIFAGGKLLAAGGRDQVVRVYDLKDQKLLRALDPAAAP